MKRQWFIACSLFFLTELANAGPTSYYCPQKHAYISIGMTAAEVINACGPPTARKTKRDPVVQQIPVVQLIYSTINQGPVFFYPGIKPLYDMWSIPSGSQGTSLEINLINNQIVTIKLNGSGTNALSVCDGGNIQVGDDINKVYSACGSPSLVNNTYINKPVSESENPQVWIYIIDQYQPSVSLTFVNGVLQSIE